MTDITIEECEELFQILNRYRCYSCDHQWADIWTAEVDDDCPNCGSKHCSPYASDRFPRIDDATVTTHHYYIKASSMDGESLCLFVEATSSSEALDLRRRWAWELHDKTPASGVLAEDKYCDGEEPKVILIPPISGDCRHLPWYAPGGVTVV